MGAPKGNTNALKHGLYAKPFSPSDRARLRSMSPEDFRQEIEMLRITVGHLFEIHSRLHARLESQSALDQPSLVDSLARVSNSLSLAMTTLNTTARTYALLTGTNASVNDAFEQALNSLPIFLDDTHLLESGAKDDKDLPEVLIE
jgi:hypothetical protein